MTFQTKRLSTGKFYYRMNKQSHLIHLYQYDRFLLLCPPLPV
ncbi:hypothetical protein M083_1543 [Bacteroides fragilis str. 3986 T(B)9]|nr:hypothetical protein M117_1432 [Bacteroides fragilis str. 3774 T13]EXY70631.1 hypothetical protein M083_1636 [Bacteroides fragilis str. 3986 T(B)9]EXZ10510.1 hypothetical protein M073_1519 [Bacteroides fragilis str. DS-71]EYA00982.1 hypothetical protein M087_1462 [Bacteroides fragilis str. S23 R14]EYE53756.1 hypothetical protein M127_1560 [Bacteroides fragilis str. S6L5]KXU44896.1 hypothetical protein HMPREF2530_02557 [Bacteroides fragilis]